MRYVIYPYKMGSQSAKALAQELGAIRVYPDRNYRRRDSDIIINWGNSKTPSWLYSMYQIRNGPINVRVASNKLWTFTTLKEINSIPEYTKVSIPDWATDVNEAKQWDGIVVCRTNLQGHSGNGIVIAHNPDEIVQAPLYTKHVRHKYEYRVHVMNGEVIDYVLKKKREGVDADTLVRSYDNGWVFAREGVELPDDVKLQACNAVSALGLDFGAVDVAYREREDKAYVLEVNTAPGLIGTTLSRYAESIRRFYGTR